jgi:outer membrane beta-barrel protein
MKKLEWKMAGLSAIAALAIQAAPASAQVQAGTQEVDVYGGELFDDTLTDEQVSGAKPELDDDITYGLRYGYNLTNSFALEASLGNAASSVTKLAGQDIDLDLTTLDLDAVWHFDTGLKLVPYVLAGAGYATTNLDRPITGTVNGQPVSLDEDEGFTLNAGVGAKYFVSDNVLHRLEARYRYVDAVLDDLDDSLNTVETTLGIGWRF